MAARNTKILMLTACSQESEAERIAHTLLDARLAGCVQVLPKMRSFYVWQGKTESADEHLLLIKTSLAKQEAAESKIVELHSYEVPEIVSLPITAGWGKYMQWLDDIVG